MIRRPFGPSLLVAILVLGCATTISSVAPSRSNPPAATASPSPAASAAPTTGQTDTAWGRIWDTLPSGFPAVPGAKPTEAADGPATATFAVEGGVPRSIVSGLQASLEAAGFRTQGLSGPLEDGTYVLDSVGAAAGCLTQVRVSPLGSVTTVTILYGARCPHD